MRTNIDNPTPNAQSPTPDTIFDIAARLEDNFKKLTSILEKLGHTDSDPKAQRPTPNALAEIAAMAEIRKHVALAEKALATAVEVHAVEEFKQIVLDALAQAAPPIQKRVLQTLAARRAHQQSQQEFRTH